MRKRINLIGEKFGLLLVESDAGLTEGKHKKYNCLCDCGNKVTRTGTSLIRSMNSSCGCFVRKGSLHSQWKGCGDISGDFWYNHVIRSANGSKYGNKIRKPKEIDICPQYGWRLFMGQDRRCALTGLFLTFPTSSKDKTYTASLDRIDSTLGYTKGNVQWVHKHVNIMKNKFDNEYFINICKLVTEGACEIT